MYIYKIIKTLFALITKKYLYFFVLMMFFFIFAALIQLISIGSIAYFVNIISNPQFVITNDLLSFLFEYFNFNSLFFFIKIYSICSLILLFFSNSVSCLSLWIVNLFSLKLGNNLQYRLYHSLLSRDYIFHKKNNYNYSISCIINDLPRLLYMVLMPFVLLCSHLLIAVVILLALLRVSFVVSISAFFFISVAYIFTYYFIRKKNIYHGRIITEKQRQVQSLLSESFGGIKEVKLIGLEDKYSNLYRSLSLKGLTSSAFISLAGDIPKFVIEFISFGAIIISSVVIISQSSDNSSENAIYLLSIYALAGYKILPCFQQIYKSVSSISANGGVVFEISDLLMFNAANKKIDKHLDFNDIYNISLHNISYSYDNFNFVLNNINLNFKLGHINTLVGLSGAGKSTLVDIVLGLLKSTEGEISVNDVAIADDCIMSYQKHLGYVPQSIFILNDTVVANVAFGVDSEFINIDKVINALHLADAFSFVDKLTAGIYTVLGTDGSNLSGGQRQRIGIARALYRQSKVLILDEPTSALDIQSENNFLLLLHNLKKDVLIVMVSHRSAAIKSSDMVFFISDGFLRGFGSYNDLCISNNDFCNLMCNG